MRNRLVALVCLLSMPACVSTGRYQQAVDDARRSQERANARESEDARKIAALSDALGHAEDATKERDAKLDEMTKSSGDMQRSIDDATAMNEQLRHELEKLGKDVDALLREKGTLASALDQARQRLEELRRAQAQADARAALYADLAFKLKKMVDAGELVVALRDGRMVLQLSNDVLFDPGKTELKPAGKAALQKVAVVLATVKGRHFQVAGHTDDQPIKLSGFASNWELSTARALEVVNFLVAKGVSSQALSAAGYGEFDPIAPNATDAGKTKNRRIEITLVPNIDELVTVPAPKK